MGAGDSRQPVIEVRDVFKRYVASDGRTTTALNGVSLDFYEGQITLLIGTSGCGKTTLLNMIAGFEMPSEGSIRVQDKPVEGPHPSRGVIFQDPTLFPWLTVWENVMFGPGVRGVPSAEAEKRAADLIEMVGLTRFRDHKPHQLSGGMRHRVAIIRTLANAPDILLADEPFTALDEHTRRKLQSDFLEIVRTTKTTVIFVTHNIEEAIYLADRMVVFTQAPGRVKAVLDVDLPRPRDIVGSAFNDYRRDLYNLITPEAAEA